MLAFGFHIVLTLALSLTVVASDYSRKSRLGPVNANRSLLRRTLQLSSRATPLNNGAYTNQTFSPTNFTIPYSNPVQNASFYSAGGGRAYWFGSAVALTTSTSGAQTVTATQAGLEAYPGRASGGGNRSTIYGSARWGSGDGTIYSSAPFEFHPTISLNTQLRPYPYGFWPIYWGSSTYGPSNDYRNDSYRPGGAQSLIIAGMDITRQDAYYFIVADAATMRGLNAILVLPYDKGGCEMWPGNPVYLFEPDNIAGGGGGTLRSLTGAVPRQNITLAPQNILQYYRSSSVTLGSNLYVNKFSANNNSIWDYWGRSPFNISAMIPSSGIGANRTLVEQNKFLDCLNQTIAAAVPIIDPTLERSVPNTPLTTNTAQSSALLLGLIIGIPAFLLVLFGGISLWFRAKKGRHPRRPGFRRIPLGRHTGGPRVVVTDRPYSFSAPMSQTNGRPQPSPPVYDPLPLGEDERPPPYSRALE